MKKAFERLLEYAVIHTTSNDDAKITPSTDIQFDLAKKLVSDMKELGIDSAFADENCYVYGWIPATEGFEECNSLGFIAHLDTAPDASGENVRPIIHENYNGDDIKLNNGVIISREVFPHLKNLTGRTLITTDGTTLLGADDKAGIAEIITMAERILTEDLPHGKICIAFTPDEEIGHGASLLDLKLFGADFAYTVDGGAENEIEYENFNAAKAVFTINGKSIHPGEAKNKMINASVLACEINAMLPKADRPEHTEDREGFYHLTDINGSVESASVSYIIRDHDESFFNARINTLRHIEKTLNETYGDGTVQLQITEQYRNMKDKISSCMHLVDNAKAAIMAAGMEPQEVPVRGGTDGAQLSYRGLPCPNLGTGGYAFHGPYEHITTEGMDKVVDILMGIVKRYAHKG